MILIGSKVLGPHEPHFEEEASALGYSDKIKFSMSLNSNSLHLVRRSDDIYSELLRDEAMILLAKPDPFIATKVQKMAVQETPSDSRNQQYSVQFCKSQFATGQLVWAVYLFVDYWKFQEICNPKCLVGLKLKKREVIPVNEVQLPPPYSLSSITFFLTLKNQGWIDYIWTELKNISDSYFAEINSDLKEE